MSSNHLILCHLLFLLHSIFPSIRVFSNKSVLHIRWPKYWSFRFSIIPSKEYSDWFPLGWTAWMSLQSKGLSRVFSNTTSMKFKSINSSPLSFFYSPTLTSIHDYWKNDSFRRNYVGKAMSLPFNKLSMLVIAFLPRSKCLLISWVQSPSAVILEPKEIKSVTVSTVFPPICHEMMGPDAMILVFWIMSFKPTF